MPAPLGELLRDRERAWNDAAALARLYTPDAALYMGAARKWLIGPRPISDFMANGFTGPYLMNPASFRVEGTNAQIAGFMVEGDGSNTPFAFFHLHLRQEREGTWRIATETELFPGPELEPTLTAEQLVKRLDEAGIERGVVLSDAYYFALGPAAEAEPGELEKVRAENDWTADQVRPFSKRLVAFFSVNPLRDYALAELERCATSGQFVGLKLHFNAAQLDYHDPEQVKRVRRILEAANRYRLPVIIHARSSDAYGQADAEVLLHQLIAAAPDVPIQIAHLWGGESFSAPALKVFADAVAAKDPVTRNLYFDVSGVTAYAKSDQVQGIVRGMRQIGFDRLLYASDDVPAKAWHALRTGLPLTPEEVQRLATNVAPYLRSR